MRTSSPIRRSIRRRTSASTRRSTRRRRRRTVRCGDRCSVSQAPIMRLVPGSNPPETALTEIYELPASTDPKADVLGFSPRGMDVDRNGVAWVALCQRTYGELRSPQVQVAAQRPEGDGTALPRRMDVLCRAAPADEGCDRRRQRRGQLLHVGRSVRHVGPGREHADQHRQRLRRRCSR